MRDGYHDQAAEGLLSFDKLREKPAALDQRRATVESELEALKGHREERHRLYGILEIKVFVKDGEAWVEMPIRPPTALEGDGGYREEVTSMSARTGGLSSSGWPSSTCSGSSSGSSGPPGFGKKRTGPKAGPR